MHVACYLSENLMLQKRYMCVYGTNSGIEDEPGSEGETI